MHILRKLIIIILLLVFTFDFPGCSEKNGAKDGKTADNQLSNESMDRKDKIKLQYAQWSAPLASTAEKAIEEYNEKNRDGIQVELLKIPRTSYNDTLNMLLSSGEGPDVFEARSEWLFSYIYKNWLYDLTGMVGDSFYNDFPAWVRDYVNDQKFKRRFYSLPSGQMTYRLIYNKDLFKRAGLDPSNPPATLEDMALYAKKITTVGKGDRRYGFALALNDAWSGLTYLMESVNSYSGVYYFNFKTGRYDLTKYSPWLNAMMKMKEDGSLFPGETTMKEDLALIQFAEGNIGMMYAENWEPVLLKELFPAKCDWAAAMPPKISRDDKSEGYVGVTATGWQVVYSKSEHPDKAFLFWKYLYSKSYNEEMFKSGGFLPTYDGIVHNTGLTPDIPGLDKFIPGSGDTVYPATPLDLDEWSRANIYMSVFNGVLPMESGLADEGSRLNMQLERNSIAGNINHDDYLNPDFTPANNIK